MAFFSAVCFKIKIEGPVELLPVVEVWNAGKRGDPDKSGALDDKESDEVTFSVRQVIRSDPDDIMYVAAVGGMVTFARHLERPKPRKTTRVAFGPVALSNPIVIKPGVDSIVVWAIGDGEGLDLSKQEDVDKRLTGLPWAMILRLSVEKNK
jgi:hypothetical protein